MYSLECFTRDTLQYTGLKNKEVCLFLTSPPAGACIVRAALSHGGVQRSRFLPSYLSESLHHHPSGRSQLFPTSGFHPEGKGKTKHRGSMSRAWSQPWESHITVLTFHQRAFCRTAVSVSQDVRAVLQLRSHAACCITSAVEEDRTHSGGQLAFSAAAPSALECFRGFMEKGLKTCLTDNICLQPRFLQTSGFMSCIKNII